MTCDGKTSKNEEYDISLDTRSSVPLHVQTAFPLWTDLYPECSSCFAWLKGCLIFSIFSLWRHLYESVVFLLCTTLVICLSLLLRQLLHFSVFPILRQLEWFYKPSKIFSISELQPLSSNWIFFCLKLWQNYHFALFTFLIVIQILLLSFLSWLAAGGSCEVV